MKRSKYHEKSIHIRRRMGMVKNNFDLNQQYDNLCNAVIKMAAEDYCKCAERRKTAYFIYVVWSFIRNVHLLKVDRLKLPIMLIKKYYCV